VLQTSENNVVEYGNNYRDYVLLENVHRAFFPIRLKCTIAKVKWMTTVIHHEYHSQWWGEIIYPSIYITDRARCNNHSVKTSNSFVSLYVLVHRIYDLQENLFGILVLITANKHSYFLTANQRTPFFRVPYMWKK